MTSMDSPLTSSWFSKIFHYEITQLCIWDTPIMQNFYMIFPGRPWRPWSWPWKKIIFSYQITPFCPNQPPFMTILYKKILTQNMTSMDSPLTRPGNSKTFFLTKYPHFAFPHNESCFFRKLEKCIFQVEPGKNDFSWKYLKNFPASFYFCFFGPN